MTTFAPQVRTRSTTGSGVTFGRLVHSELLKLRTLRSTLVVALLVVVSSVLGVMAFSSGGTVIAIASGTALGVVFVAVLGALSVPVEVNTGTVQPTFLAAPRRSAVLLAKATVIAVVSGVLAVIGNTIGVIVIGATITPATIGELLLSGLAMALTGPMFVFAGALIRSVPAAVTVAILFSVLLQNIVALVRIGSVWLSDYLPSESASGLITADGAGEFVRCLVVLVCWLTAIAIPAVRVVRGRDA